MDQWSYGNNIDLVEIGILYINSLRAMILQSHGFNRSSRVREKQDLRIYWALKFHHHSQQIYYQGQWDGSAGKTGCCLEWRQILSARPTGARGKLFFLICSLTSNKCCIAHKYKNSYIFFKKTTFNEGHFMLAHSLHNCFSIILIFWPFNTVPYDMVTPSNHKIITVIFLLLWIVR